MVYCFNCGEEVEDLFCESCGTDFEVQEKINTDEGIKALVRPATMANASSSPCILCGSHGNPYYFLADPDNIDTPVHLHCVRKLLMRGMNE